MLGQTLNLSKSQILLHHFIFVKKLEIKFYHYKYQRLDTSNKGALLGLKWSFYSVHLMNSKIIKKEILK